MNAYLYGYGPERGRRWLLVDVGVTFAGAEDPGVDVILPDLRFIEEQRQSLAAIVLTHAHEDHFGAVLDLWPRLKVPVYATPFCAALLKAKASENGIAVELPLRIVPLKSRFKVGPFDVELVSMTHSIPESNGLVIRTDAGRVFHTGDWKFENNPTPQGGETDIDAIKALASEGLDAIVCDSTNALRPGFSPGEVDVARTLVEIIKTARHRVVVTTFASNVARIKTVADAAAAAGRELVVIGRAMHRVIRAAMETGYLPEGLKYLDQRDFGYLDRRHVVALATGSQGEPRAAIARIAEDTHPDVSLSEGDIVIFSSRNIPGNELAISRTQNGLAEIGCEIITDGDALVHATGHPRREELKRMYGLCKPRAAIPMHGEPRHLEANEAIARGEGVREIVSARNGDVVRIAPGPAEIIDDVPVGRLHRDGRLVVPANEGPVRARRKLAFSGIAVVSLVVSPRGELLADPKVVLDGMPDLDADGESLADQVLEAVGGALASIPKPQRKNSDTLQEAARRAARAAIERAWGKKPICKVILTRVS
ncbi:MAG: ribonuclease J [Hyphomicrobiaceae bacterium]|nr:MAG: ribonuclease J [Hyphomicrobiaceae bacterium]